MNFVRISFVGIAFALIGCDGGSTANHGQAQRLTSVCSALQAVGVDLIEENNGEPICEVIRLLVQGIRITDSSSPFFGQVFVVSLTPKEQLEAAEYLTVKHGALLYWATSIPSARKRNSSRIASVLTVKRIPVSTGSTLLSVSAMKGVSPWIALILAGIGMVIWSWSGLAQPNRDPNHRQQPNHHN